MRSRLVPVASLTTLTDAPGSTPPDESLTVPEMTPVVPWATTNAGANSSAAAVMTERMSANDLNENMTPPKKIKRVDKAQDALAGVDPRRRRKSEGLLSGRRR